MRERRARNKTGNPTNDADRFNGQARRLEYRAQYSPHSCTNNKSCDRSAKNVERPTLEVKGLVSVAETNLLLFQLASGITKRIQ